MARALLIGGCWICAAVFPTIIVAQVGNFRTESEIRWVAWFFFPGFVLAFIGQTLLSPGSPPDEYWDTIGGPEG